MELQQLADKVEVMQKDVSEMKDFLLGNQFNEKKGIASIIEDHDKRIEQLEEHKIITKAYTDLVKVVIGFLITGLIGLTIYFLQHK